MFQSGAVFFSKTSLIQLLAWVSKTQKEGPKRPPSGLQGESQRTWSSEPSRSSKAQNRALVIRTSSIGDIAQALPSATDLFQAGFEVHWLTKPEFAGLVKSCSHVHRVWTLEHDLASLLEQLSQAGFTHLYDSQNNLRSRWIRWRLRWLQPFLKVCVKPSQRLRKYLWIRWGWNSWKPFYISQYEFRKPLRNFGLAIPQLSPNSLFSLEGVSLPADFGEHPQRVCLAPVAQHALKKWPLDHWRELIRSLPEVEFHVLGGAQEKELEALGDLPNVRLWHGRLSLEESLRVVQACGILVGNDTGLTHWADAAGIPCLLLLGPTAFGRTARKTSQTLELALPCRPCSKFGKDRCRISDEQKCMRSLLPTQVRKALVAQLQARSLATSANAR